MNLLNLGCGNTFHKDWINIDFVSNSKDVKAHNLLEGIPFDSQSMDVVYHSHVLEHFSKSDGVHFIKECHRVLKTSGVIRIAIPDLERIAKEYLKNLELAASGDNDAKHNYNWIILELFDQMVRNESGGEMKDYLYQEVIPNEPYVYERIGMEGKHIRHSYLNRQQKPLIVNIKSVSILTKIIQYIRKLLQSLTGRQFHSKLSEIDKKALQIGQFRLGGEIHHWMYDRYSLSELLKAVGFGEIQICSATQSKIANWERFQLDVVNGEIRKPDSLFIEAIKL